MILEVSAAAPAWVRAAADAVLYLHIGAAALGLASGTAALMLRKGGRGHRLAGHLFFVSMLIMAGVGAAVAPFLPQRGSVLAGLTTFYLVATAWLTVRRPAGTAGRVDVMAFCAAAGLVALALVLGLAAAADPSHTLDGQPRQALVLFGALVLMAAAGDLKVVLHRGISGTRRIARHVWRMCTALFIAAVSYFLGQQQTLPTFVQGSPLLFLPPLAVLLAMTVWLVRIRFGERSRPETAHV